MQNYHDVKIIQNKPNETRIFIDGKEIQGVTDISYRNYVGGMPSVSIEFIPKTLNCDKGEIIETTEIGGIYRKYITEESGE